MNRAPLANFKGKLVKATRDDSPSGGRSTKRPLKRWRQEKKQIFFTALIIDNGLVTNSTFSPLTDLHIQRCFSLIHWSHSISYYRSLIHSQAHSSEGSEKGNGKVLNRFILEHLKSYKLFCYKLSSFQQKRFTAEYLSFELQEQAQVFALDIL